MTWVLPIRKHEYDRANRISQWLDLLTAYDGQSITYDEIGNPTSYYNGTRWAFEWEKGRQLTTAESDSHEISYTYDMAGIRNSKTVDGVTYNYQTLNGKVVRQTWGSNVLDIIYDANGKPYAFWYNSTYCLYVLNQQGDVIRVIKPDGTIMAKYQYDAWGNIISSSGSLANVNPLRYRGYYYDAETGFYYLQSRYYDPSIGRFINADSYASTGQGFLGHNMFAYCGNNPVIGFDPTGSVNWGGICLGIGIGILAVGAVALTVATAGAASPLAAGVVTTAGTVASGALIESSVVTTIGAWTESTVVYDVTCIAGNDRFGCSYVYDFSEDDSEWYLHTGSQSKSELGVTFGSGFVFNYNGEGSYGGTFIDVSKSTNYKGALLGADYCTSPDNFINGYTSCHALLATSGLSTSFNFSKNHHASTAPQ